jgi:hypothetical protein
MNRLALVVLSALLLALLLLGAMACGAAPKSGVRGTALMGGGPVIADIPAHRWPNRATVVVHEGDAGGTVVASVKPDSSGAFTIDLVPGTYTLVQSGGSDSGGPSKTVTVERGSYAKVTLLMVAP